MMRRVWRAVAGTRDMVLWICSAVGEVICVAATSAYKAAINVCEKGGELEEAMQLVSLVAQNEVVGEGFTVFHLGAADQA